MCVHWIGGEALEENECSENSGQGTSVLSSAHSYIGLGGPAFFVVVVNLDSLSGLSYPTLNLILGHLCQWLFLAFCESPILPTICV